MSKWIKKAEEVSILDVIVDRVTDSLEGEKIARFEQIVETIAEYNVDIATEVVEKLKANGVDVVD